MNNPIILSIVSAVIGGFAALVVVNMQAPSEEDLIKEFYEVETAVYVSPHGLRKHIADPTHVIVDLRSQEEYENSHIISAVSIPAYATPDKSDYGAVERIISSFQKLKDDNPDKDIIVYCYSTPCMTGRKIGKMLADHDIYVKHLGIGWNEWRYYWNKWNHDGETQVTPADYIASGSEPGEFVGEGGTACPLGGDFGC